MTVAAALFSLPLATGLALGAPAREAARRLAGKETNGQSLSPDLHAAMLAGTAEWERIKAEYEIVEDADFAAGEAVNP